MLSFLFWQFPQPLRGADRETFMRMTVMKKFAHSFVEFLKEEDGPTAVEYAVMLALIVVVCLTAVTNLGTAASESFQESADIIAGPAS